MAALQTLIATCSSMGLFMPRFDNRHPPSDQQFKSTVTFDVIQMICASIRFSEIEAYLEYSSKEAS
jgi:hypothetical protein